MHKLNIIFQAAFVGCIFYVLKGGTSNMIIAFTICCSIFAYFADYFFAHPGVLIFIILIVLARIALD